MHAHLHSHAVVHGHEHGHGATAVGLLHGLAGSGSAVALIPVIGFDSPAPAVLYLIAFALGTAGGMAVYGVLAGTVMRRAAERSVGAARLVACVTGLATAALGIVWLAR